jgi:hypothetical protein
MREKIRIKDNNDWGCDPEKDEKPVMETQWKFEVTFLGLE